MITIKKLLMGIIKLIYYPIMFFAGLLIASAVGFYIYSIATLTFEESIGDMIIDATIHLTFFSIVFAFTWRPFLKTMFFVLAFGRGVSMLMIMAGFMLAAIEAHYLNMIGLSINFFENEIILFIMAGINSIAIYPLFSKVMRKYKEKIDSIEEETFFTPYKNPLKVLKELSIVSVVVFILVSVFYFASLEVGEQVDIPSLLFVCAFASLFVYSFRVIYMLTFKADKYLNIKRKKSA